MTDGETKSAHAVTLLTIAVLRADVKTLPPAVLAARDHLLSTIVAAGIQSDATNGCQNDSTSGGISCEVA